MRPTPTDPKLVTLPEIRRAAREKLPRDHWNFDDGGAEGAARVCEIMGDELQMNMELCGRTKIPDLTPDLILPAD